MVCCEGFLSFISAGIDIHVYITLSNKACHSSLVMHDEDPDSQPIINSEVKYEVHTI